MTTLKMGHLCTFIYIGLQLILLLRQYITIAYTKKKIPYRNLNFKPHKNKIFRWLDLCRTRYFEMFLFLLRFSAKSDRLFQKLTVFKILQYCA